MLHHAATARRDVPDVVKALALVVVYASWNALAEVLYAHLRVGSYDRAHPLRIAAVLLQVGVPLAGVVWLGCVVWAKRSLASLGWTPVTLRSMSHGLLLTALLVAGVLGFVALLRGADGVHRFTDAVAAMPAAERVYFAVMGAIVAFAEETLFRGLLLPALARSTGAAGAVVLSAAAFAVYHRSVFPLPFLFVKAAMGVLFAVFTLRTRSLVPAWTGHALLWAVAGDN